MDETQDPKEQGPLPRSREAVDWWLKKWGRDAVVAGIEPLTGEDVERLIQVNGGTAKELDLAARDMRRVRLLGPDLQSAHLKGGGLQGANLRGANLLEAELPGVDLGYANLQGANLASANLQGTHFLLANLQGANLGWADLQGADLWRANLQGANLGWVKFQGAFLARASISPGTNLEGVEWDPKYINVLERRGLYEAASAVYRRLKEWYRGAGMLTIAGEFHFREREASRKAKGQRLRRQFKEGLAAAWRRLKAGDVSAPTKE